MKSCVGGRAKLAEPCVRIKGSQAPNLTHDRGSATLPYHFVELDGEGNHSIADRDAQLRDRLRPGTLYNSGPDQIYGL